MTERLTHRQAVSRYARIRFPFDVGGNQLLAVDKPYVEMRDGDYYISGTRISLASVVYAYLDGHSPEGIQDCYPLLTLEQIHGAIAFYLGHKAEMETHLENKRHRYEQQRQAARDADPAFYEEMADRRQRLSKPQ
jgi:uncharacterized protein (DUF433 family)